jgi:hypothetical protein
MVNRRPRTSIRDLDDDSLLNIFHFCRSSIIERDAHGNILWGHWGSERWWYKLVHVCQRWRLLILGSVSHLGLCLVCTHGTPVADMLAHSPPLPLIIDHDHQNQEFTVEDEEGIMAVLQHRDRVHRIYLSLPGETLHKLIPVITGEFPMLEYLHLAPPTEQNTKLILPMTFRAPHLRHLILNHFSSPIGSPLLTTTVGLVTLVLWWIHPSTYLHLDDLLRSFSILPQLETLEIGFRSPVPMYDVERQLSPINTHVILPNLHWFAFWGISPYLEALLPQMTTPLLETLNVHFFNQLRFSVPHLRQFMTTTENFRFSSVRFLFYHEAVAVFVYPQVGDRLVNFNVEVTCKHLDWQVSAVAQIFNDLGPLFPAVVDLALEHREHTLSSEGHNQADRTQWRQLLGSFRNVKTFSVHHGLVGELSRSLRLEGEPPLEVLPELEELVCPTESIRNKAFTPFIREHVDAGRFFRLVGEDFPVGRGVYNFHSSTGVYRVPSD